MQNKQTPVNVLSTKKVKKALFATLATVTVLSQMLTVYPTTGAAAVGSEIGTTETPTQVGDFETLKRIIEQDNGITNIELTADITMTGPINVNLNKTELTINGNGHTFTESKLDLLAYTATVYVAPNSKMQTMNIKNMKIRGTHYYAPFQVHDYVKGVVQNFENIDYVGPQMVANTYGTANFTGTNTVDITQFDGLGTLYQMVRANKVNIAGNFTANHRTTTLNTFQIYGEDSYVKIQDGANVNIQTNGGKFIGSAANTTDFTVGKNATFNLDTKAELFTTAMANVMFDTNSTTTINRKGVDADALMLVAQNFTVNSNASLVAKQDTGSTAHIIRTTVANATINFNGPRKLDLDANGTGANRVFSAYGKTTINFKDLAELGVFKATNKTETPDLSWDNVAFQVIQASGQAGIVQVGAISSTNDIQTKFVLADAKRITTTGNAADVAEKARQDAALKAVNELFNSDKPSTDVIKDTTNQAAIDAAKVLVDAVTDPTVKAALQKDLNRAQELLDAKNAAAAAEKAKQDAALKAVNELFNNNTPATDAIKGTTDQAAVNAAKALVDAVTDPTVKAALQKDLNRAQELLDAKNAAAATEKAKQDAALKAVNELFNNNTPATDAIKGTTDQAAINAAKVLVDAVTDPTVKAALQKDLNRAQELLDAKNAAAATEKAKQDAALKAVNELFNNNTPATDAIKGTTDQAAINAAKALVDAVTDPTVKAALQKDLNRAQELLDASNVLAKPQLNPMTEADTVFSGKLDIAKYNPGTIRIYINNTPATVVAVDASGNFSYNIGNRKAGDTISVDYKDRTGQYNTATKTSITVTPVSSNVTINKMTENDDTITGKTAPNAKVRYVVGGQPVNVGYADVNGNYTMYIGKQKVGTVVGVEVFDPATNKYKAAVTTTVLAVNVTIQAMTNATDTVSGTAPANAKLRFLIGGVAVNVGTADANGNYSKYVGTQIVGTEVAVEMLNPETGKYELAKKIQVTGAPKSTTYTVNALTTEDDTLKGTAPANAKLRFSINGNLISVITADASGNYSKYIGKQKAGVDVSVELLNENTNQYTAPQSVTVTTGTGNATLAPVINTITEGQGVVTGTVPTSISQVRVWVNGTAQTMVAVTNGNFTWTKANLKADDTVKVDYKDAAGTWISAEKIVTN
ncbi:hypothetical protein HCB69_13910 [Listeria booriae]|uniref:Pesticidal crystal protein Cry1Aa domain-containing protein n=1 Tax=Listeria booriae TaxID=1552123 RepID=A0A842FY98_9LIST|nr:toxin Cry1Ac domain D-VI-related protein [Listeria booriae]MBC2285480.1 hypothetical protein [Listeria booriae]MBC2293926.1 hypothetical protein [Listeria booriae]